MKKKLIEGIMFIMILLGGSAIALFTGIGFAEMVSLDINPIWATVLVALVMLVTYIVAIIALAIAYDFITKLLRTLKAIWTIVKAVRDGKMKIKGY